MTLYQVFPMERFHNSLDKSNDEKNFHKKLDKSNNEEKFQKSLEMLNDEEHFHKSLEKSNDEEKESNENENVAIPNSTSKNSIISLT